jgi:hypothetical protein
MEIDSLPRDSRSPRNITDIDPLALALLHKMPGFFQDTLSSYRITT